MKSNFYFVFIHFTFFTFSSPNINYYKHKFTTGIANMFLEKETINYNKYIYIKLIRKGFKYFCRRAKILFVSFCWICLSINQIQSSETTVS